MKKNYRLILFIALLFLAGTNIWGQTIPSYVPSNGLVGWWPFNGNANDESGNGNNGTVNGATLTIDRNGNANSAYYFNGNANNIVVPNSNSLNPNVLTINVWIKAAGDNVTIIEKGNASNALEHCYAITHNDYWQIQRGLKTSFGIGNCSQISGTTSWSNYNEIINNTWTMITVSIDNSGNIKHYKNGILFHTELGSPLVCCNTATSTLRFGGSHWSSDPEWFNGIIDDIGIWNRALTQQEITQLYNNSTPCNISNNIFLQDTIFVNGQDSFILDAGSGYNSYLWNNGSNLQSIHVNNSGKYTINVFDNNGCFGVDSIYVNILSEKIIQNDTIINFGDTITLNISGVNNGSGISQWQLLINENLYNSSEINLSSSGYDAVNRKLYSVFKTSTVNRVYVFDLVNNSVNSLVSSNAPNEIRQFAYDFTNNRIISTRSGRDNVYSLPVNGGAWQQIGNGSFDSESYGSTAFWNPISGRFGFFAGYGLYATKNWIWENNGSWVNTYANNNNCQPAKRVTNQFASNNQGNKLYFFSGYGSCDGNQNSATCSLGSPWQNDIGQYCWLRDIWELDLTTNQFTSILPSNNQSIVKEGAFTYDCNNNSFYILGGFTPTDNYNVNINNFGNSFTMDVYRYRKNIDLGFSKITTTGIPPQIPSNSLGVGCAFYDNIGSRIIYARKDGIWALNLNKNNYSYSWSTGDTTQNINISPNQTTTYYCTISNGIYSYTDSIIVYVLVQNSLQPLGSKIKIDTNSHISYWNGFDAWIPISSGLPGQNLVFVNSLPNWINNPQGITTITASTITSISAISGGNIKSDGGSKIIAKGVCWSTSPNPTVANNKTLDGEGIGSFTSNLSGLTSGTTYFVRSYSTNSAGTSYGNEISFTTTLP